MGFINPGMEILKLPSLSQIRDFGLSIKNIKIVDTIDELRNIPPNIIIAESIKNFEFVVDYVEKVFLKKHGKYIMALGLYNQLRNNGKNLLLKPAQVKFKNIYKPYTGQDLDNKSLLVFRTGGIGDLLFIQPNLIYLKNKYPTCKIIFGCAKRYQSMVNQWDCVDEIISWPFQLNKMIEIDYHAIFEGVIERNAESKKVNAYRLFTRWIGLNLEDKYLIPKQSAEEFSISECSRVLKTLGLKENNFVLLQPRASSQVRTPNFETVWKKIISNLMKDNIDVAIIDSPHTSPQIKKYIEEYFPNDRVFNLSEYSKDLSFMISFAKLSRLCLSTDSSLIHIGASLGKKIFGIYGPFPGNIRLDTYPNCDWVDAKLHCGPCFLHGHKECFNATSKGYSKCYDYLDFELTHKKIKELFEK